ncbi:hypothetical protein J7K19_06135 [bacterium]|nr:hypothetical protein [bacterium]
MTLKKREKILLSIMTGAVVLFIVNQFLCSSQKSQLGQSASTTKTSRTRKTNAKGPTTYSQIKPNQLQTWIKRQPNVVYSSWGRDPFLGAFTRELLDSLGVRREKPYVLKAISWKDGKAIVLINNDIIKVGETKNGLTVLAVEGDRVVCRKYGSIFSLRLGD